MTGTIGELLAARADDHFGGIRTVDGESWTWADVVRESAARAAVFEELGVAGRHVGVLLGNTPEFVFLLGAAALSGSVVVAINPTRRGEELARDVRHTDCAVVLTDTAQAALLDKLDLGAPVRVVDKTNWLTAVDRHASAPVPSPRPDPDALLMLIFTSGSTGAPKAVRLSQGRAARTAAKSAVAFTADSVLYCPMPLFHGNALMANLFPALATGATVVLKERFSATTFLADVRAHGCTYFTYVGRALSYILAQPERPDDADNPLQWCLGTEASPRDRQEFKRRFGCFVMEGYSSSEGGVVIQPFSGMPKNALGRPDDGADVAVVDPETGAECPRAVLGPDGALLNGEVAIGEIVGRDGIGGFEGYYANENATAERTRQGWYWTGDLGYRDAEGTFYFAGRTADWLRVDGENFAAGPIETIVARFPAVTAVVVYAVPDPVTGDQVMAAVEMAPGAEFDGAAFAAFLADQADLGTKWAPRFVRIVARIPLTATEKVDRKPLRAERWDTDDPVWWRPTPGEPYRLMTGEDRSALRVAFAEAGRSGVLT